MIEPDPDQDRDDPRPDIEQAVESRADEADAAEGGDTDSPLEPPGVFDGNSGVAGVTKNQDRTAQ